MERVERVEQVSPYNCEEIVVRYQTDGSYIIEKREAIKPHHFGSDLESVISDYVGNKKVERIAKKIKEKINEMDGFTNKVTSSIDLLIEWKDGKIYCISDSENGKPELVEYNEKVPINPEEEIKTLAEDFIEEDEIEEFTKRIVKTCGLDDEKYNRPKYFLKDGYLPNYMPPGYKYLDGTIDEGNYSIIDSFGNIFTWISPQPESFWESAYDGFWVSTYDISKDENGMPKSVEKGHSWGKISYYEAEKQAKRLGGRLMSKREYKIIVKSARRLLSNYKYWIREEMKSINEVSKVMTGHYKKVGIYNYEPEFIEHDPMDMDMFIYFRVVI